MIMNKHYEHCFKYMRRLFAEMKHRNMKCVTNAKSIRL